MSDHATWFFRNRLTARCSWSSDCRSPAALIRSSSSSTSATSLSGPMESSPPCMSDWRTLLHSSTHWSQMKTPGPATSLRTLSLPFPQKEQRHERRLPASRELFPLNTACQATLTVRVASRVLDASGSDPEAECSQPSRRCPDREGQGLAVGRVVRSVLYTSTVLEAMAGQPKCFRTRSRPALPIVACVLGSPRSFSMRSTRTLVNEHRSVGVKVDQVFARDEVVDPDQVASLGGNATRESPHFSRDFGGIRAAGHDHQLIARIELKGRGEK